MSFCKVIISNSSQFFQGKIDCFTYSLPENLTNVIGLGSIVRVPFGKEKENALVVELQESLSEEEQKFKIREVEDLISPEPIYKQEFIELIKFTSDYYSCKYSEVLDAALPSNLIKKPQKEILLVQESLDFIDDPILKVLQNSRSKKLAYPRVKMLSKLPTEEFKKSLKELVKKGSIRILYKVPKVKAPQSVIERNNDPLVRFQTQVNDIQVRHVLNIEQARVLEEIERKYNAERAPKFLIHGVTGSGKTEIYLRLIEKTIKNKKSVILLVPEISLAPQLVEKVSQNFANNQVLIWHSAITSAEKEFTFCQLQQEEARIVVGARSAIFAPVKNLGLIIIDEEHENTYKQESPNPRYHARLLAIKRAELNHSSENPCPIVMGSATPSVELYYKAESEQYPDYHLLKMLKRVKDIPMPEVRIVDMREEFLEGNKTVFSKALKEQIQEALRNEEQVILFLNKRGSASHVFCRTCGYVYKCPNCEAKMVYHEVDDLMICHHCAVTAAHPDSCPECEMNTIKFFGLGTQKLVTETQRHFPEARIARLDSDTSKVKHAYLDIWQKFKAKKIDILIGTQMIAKGLDMPELNTVGVISADSNFSHIDYLGEERGFQLLTQVAGRAGRDAKQGNVVFQSYQPDREILLKAKEQNYEGFYKTEIKNREDFIYPPFSTLIRFVSSAEDEATAIEIVNKFHECLYQMQEENAAITLLGPSPCIFTKIKRKYRYHMLVKLSHELASADYDKLLEEIKSSYQAYKTPKDTVFTMDVDSVSLN